MFKRPESDLRVCLLVKKDQLNKNCWSFQSEWYVGLTLLCGRNLTSVSLNRSRETG